MDTAKQAGQTARDLAQKIAKRMAREPLEVLKKAESQVTGSEEQKPQEMSPQSQSTDTQAKIIERRGQFQDKIKSTRRVEAYQRELDDIRKRDLFKDLQRRISEGEEIPLEDYPELTMEQKQVLKAQMEAVRREATRREAAGQNVLEVPGSKRGRRFGQTRKQEVERQQTRVEKPVPPSG